MNRILLVAGWMLLTLPGLHAQEPAPAANDIKARLFRSCDQFVRGRHYLVELKETLAARKDWLEKNGATGKGE